WNLCNWVVPRAGTRNCRHQPGKALCAGRKKQPASASTVHQCDEYPDLRQAELLPRKHLRSHQFVESGPPDPVWLETAFLGEQLSSVWKLRAGKGLAQKVAARTPRSASPPLLTNKATPSRCRWSASCSNLVKAGCPRSASSHGSRTIAG